MRRKYIDWLRIFGILLLFPFHAARVFDSREFNYIHSDTRSFVGEAFMDIIWPISNICLLSFFPIFRILLGIVAPLLQVTCGSYYISFFSLACFYRCLYI